MTKVGAVDQRTSLGEVVRVIDLKEAAREIDQRGVGPEIDPKEVGLGIEETAGETLRETREMEAERSWMKVKRKVMKAVPVLT